jgi:hypothetical protein
MRTEVSTYIGWYTRNRMHNPMIKPVGIQMAHSLHFISVPSRKSTGTKHGPFLIHLPQQKSHCSAVGKATGCGLDVRGVGVRVPVGSKNFQFSTSSRPAPGPTQPPIHCVPGVLSLGVKRPGSEADLSPPTSAEVKKTWIYNRIAVILCAPPTCRSLVSLSLSLSLNSFYRRDTFVA